MLINIQCTHIFSTAQIMNKNSCLVPSPDPTLPASWLYHVRIHTCSASAHQEELYRLCSDRVLYNAAYAVLLLLLSCTMV